MGGGGGDGWICGRGRGKLVGFDLGAPQRGLPGLVIRRVVLTCMPRVRGARLHGSGVRHAERRAGLGACAGCIGGVGDGVESSMAY